MKQLIKKWKKWKKQDEICNCIQSGNSNYKPGSIILHTDDCPAAPAVRTDFGKFMVWLSKEKT